MRRGVRCLCVAVLGAAVLGGCSSFQKNLDISGLRNLANTILADGDPGTAEELTHLLDAAPFADRSTFPLADVARRPLTTWILKDPPDGHLVEERVSFPSTIRPGDQAVFYYYHRGNPSGRRVILFVPGFGVSNFAYTFIKRFMEEAVVRDYDVLLYNLPYHLERTLKGKKDGDGFFKADPAQDIRTAVVSLEELRTAVTWLKSLGTRSIGGWGGSVGAALLYLLSGSEAIDHMALMIPIVDWSTLIFSPELSALRERAVESGIPEDLIRRAYSEMSPASYPTMTAPSRIQILYGAFDQLTPAPLIERFARTQGITDIHLYQESHTTILLDERMYRDYDTFLNRME